MYMSIGYIIGTIIGSVIGLVCKIVEDKYKKHDQTDHSETSNRWHLR